MKKNVNDTFNLRGENEWYDLKGNYHYSDYSRSGTFGSSFCNSVRFILFFVIALLVLFIIYRIASNSSALTFTSFLDYLNNVSSSTIDLKFVIELIKDDWGFFNFLRNFINLSVSVINFAIYLVGGLINLVQFAIGFLSFLLP